MPLEALLLTCMFYNTCILFVHKSLDCLKINRNIRFHTYCYTILFVHPKLKWKRFMKLTCRSILNKYSQNSSYVFDYIYKHRRAVKGQVASMLYTFLSKLEKIVIRSPLVRYYLQNMIPYHYWRYFLSSRKIKMSFITIFLGELRVKVIVYRSVSYIYYAYHFFSLRKTCNFICFARFRLDKVTHRS